MRKQSRASTLCTSMIAGKSRRRNSMAKYLRDRELFFKEGHPSTIVEDDVLKVGFKRLSEGATIPTKAHATDSGFDLCASEDVIIEPGETVIVPTGIAVELPEGYEAQVRPRSGVTAKTKLRVQLGTIDNGYVGEVGVIVDNIRATRDGVDILDGSVNASKSHQVDTIDGSTFSVSKSYKAFPYLIRKGDRLAQLVVHQMPQVEAIEVTDIDDTDRGNKGYGSSGVSWRDNVNPPSIDELKALGEEVLRRGSSGV